MALQLMDRDDTVTGQLLLINTAIYQLMNSSSYLCGREEQVCEGNKFAVSALPGKQSIPQEPFQATTSFCPLVW